MRYDTPADTTTVASGGCIRFGQDGIYLHHNDTHSSVGIRTWDFDHKGRLDIRHSAPGPIITMGAFADETLVSRGIALGLSGGGGKTVLQAAYKGRALDLRNAFDYALISGTYCNAWLFWLHDTSS